MAKAAEVWCSKEEREVSFFLSGSGGNGNAIFTLNDKSWAMKCKSFGCIAEPLDVLDITLGVQLDMTPSPDELLYARMGILSGPI